MMNWPLAIERNRDALLRIVATLFALAGLEENAVLGPDPRMPRHLRNYLLRILRPAESAVRRLIVIVARDLSAGIGPVRESSRSQTPRKASATGIAYPPGFRPADAGRKAPPERLSLPLIDPLKRFSLHPPRRRPKGFPRISIIGVTEPRPIPDNRIPAPDDEVDATRLGLRLAALKRALDDLPGQAKRLARWRARRDAGRLRSPRVSPLRPGWPPGYRKRAIHEVDDVLRECHGLARHALDSPSVNHSN